MCVCRDWAGQTRRRDDQDPGLAEDPAALPPQSTQHSSSSSHCCCPQKPITPPWQWDINSTSDAAVQFCFSLHFLLIRVYVFSLSKWIWIGLSSLSGQKKVQARAVFYPLTGKGGAINMCYRTLYIGSGKTCWLYHSVWKTFTQLEFGAHWIVCA